MFGSEILALFRPTGKQANHSEHSQTLSIVTGIAPGLWVRSTSDHDPRNTTLKTPETLGQ